MQTAQTSGQFENSVFEIRAIREIHALLQDVLVALNKIIRIHHKYFSRIGKLQPDDWVVGLGDGAG